VFIAFNLIPQPSCLYCSASTIAKMKDKLEGYESDDDFSSCERGDGSSVETASLTKEPSLASSCSNDTLEDCFAVSPAKIRRLRLRHGGFPSPFPAPYEISLIEEELLLKRDDDQAELLFLHDNSQTPSHPRRGKIKGRSLFVTFLWSAFLFSFWSIASSFREPGKWHMPSRRLVRKIGKRSMKAVDKEAGLTIRLTGSRINLLHQSLETLGHCDKVSQIQIDWKEVDESFPETLLSHDSEKVVDASASTKFATDAVLLLEESVRLTCDDLDRALQQWKLDPSRIVGFLPDSDRLFSQLSDHASIVHRYYLSNRPRRDGNDPCQHFSLSVFITAVSEKGPVVITSDLIRNQDHITIARACLDELSLASGKPPMPVGATRYLGLHS